MRDCHCSSASLFVRICSTGSMIRSSKSTELYVRRDFWYPSYKRAILTSPSDDAFDMATAGSISPFFQAEICCMARSSISRFPSFVCSVSSFKTLMLSSLSRIEKPFLRPKSSNWCRMMSKPRVWNVDMRKPFALVLSVSLLTRSRISLAALFVKVTAAMCLAGIPHSSMSQAIFLVITEVLPLPAPARTSSGPST